MKITYDSEADCAYIEFMPGVMPAHFITGVHLRDEFDETFEMNCDITDDGKLQGIEIVFASLAFTPEMLASFEQLEK